MNFKIIFGILIPLLIIIILSTLGSITTGLTSNIVYSESISLEEISQYEKVVSALKIGEIQINNDYFLSRRYILPQLSACLIDKGGIKEILDIGSISYSGGDYGPSDGIITPYPRNNGDQTIQLSANGEKKLKIYLHPDYKFSNQNYSLLVQQFSDYDSVVVLPLKNNDYRYNPCSYLDPERINSGYFIPFTT